MSSEEKSLVLAFLRVLSPNGLPRNVKQAIPAFFHVAVQGYVPGCEETDLHVAGLLGEETYERLWDAADANDEVAHDALAAYYLRVAQATIARKTAFAIMIALDGPEWLVHGSYEQMCEINNRSWQLFGEFVLNNNIPTR